MDALDQVAVARVIEEFALSEVQHEVDAPDGVTVDVTAYVPDDDRRAFYERLAKELDHAGFVITRKP